MKTFTYSCLMVEGKGPKWRKKALAEPGVMCCSTMLQLLHTYLDIPILTSTTARSFLAKTSLIPVFNSGADLLKFRFPTKRLKDVVGSVAVQKKQIQMSQVWNKLYFQYKMLYIQHISTLY